MGGGGGGGGVLCHDTISCLYFLCGHLHMYACAVTLAFVNVSCKLAFFLVSMDVDPDQHFFADILELEEYTHTELGEYY